MGIIRDSIKKRQLENQLKIEELERKIETSKAIADMAAAQQESIKKIVNSGYSHGGASQSATWARGSNWESFSAKEDIERNQKTLRERSRDLYMNAPLATAAVNSMRTNVVGAGLVPKPKIDYEFLGISADEAKTIREKIKKEWELWAESTLCDALDINNFYELQQIAIMDWLKNGEEFALIEYGEKLTSMPYQLRIKLIEADRVCTRHNYSGEYSGTDTMLPNGNRIMNGIEIDKNGRVMAYHICSTYPSETGVSKKEWTRVEKRGKKTGNPNVLHIFNAERAEQYRGVPYLAPVIQSVKQMTQYTEAEIMAAVINAILAIFITTNGGEEITGFKGEDVQEEQEERDEIKLGSGSVTFLRDGEAVTTVKSEHPAGNYEAFVRSMAMQIGAALEIAPEVILKDFKSSFSASKGALNETWRAIDMRRKWFINDFCQEIYNLFIAEGVAKGRIEAPGFFTDPLIRRAYTNATWNGPARGCLDPGREIDAAVTRIENGISTREDECAQMNGSDFDDNVRTLISENEKLMAANVKMIVKGEKDGGN